MLSCHNAAVYGIYGIGTTLCIFNGTGSVVVIEGVGRGSDVGGGVVFAQSKSHEDRVVVTAAEHCSVVE